MTMERVLGGVPAAILAPDESVSHPQCPQTFPPSIHCRAVFVRGDLNMGSDCPQSGHDFRR